MRAYVETNFVLELVLRQEQEASCAGLLSLAKSGAVELVLPAFSIIEPYHAVEGRLRTRRQFVESFRREGGDLVRSSPYQVAQASYDLLLNLFTESMAAEEPLLEAIRAELVTSARLVPVDASVLSAATGLQPRFELSAQDARDVV